MKREIRPRARIVKNFVIHYDNGCSTAQLIRNVTNIYFRIQDFQTFIKRHRPYSLVTLS